MKKYLSAFGLVCCLLGCARGESKTIEELIAVAQERLAEAVEQAQASGEDALDAEVVRLKDELLNLLAIADDGKALAGDGLVKIGEDLSNLVPKASATSRAALTEASKQFDSLGREVNVSSDQVKLLVARTLHSLSSEIETTKFKQ